MKSGDIAITIGIIFIILMIIIPIPLFLVDILLSLNISLALLILLISMYNKEALDFSVFPSLLLITTLFPMIKKSPVLNQRFFKISNLRLF